jgi:hypothetical protein
MSFLHWWMIWLVPLALLPIILHLLTLQRLRTVELPTFRFLFDSYVQQRRRMQFLEALLAMLRTLFLLLFIVMVGRPVVKHWDRLFGAAAGSGGRDVILLVDASASMNAKSAGTSAFERGRAAARAVVDRLGKGDQVTLVRVGARPEEVFSRFNTDTKGIQAKIDELQPGSSRANLFAALLHLFGPEAARRTSPALYLFTDCQSNSWKEVRTQGLDRLLPAGTSFTVVDVGPRQAPSNLAVVGDPPRRNRAIAGLPFLLTPRIVNHGKSEVEVTLSVHVDDKQVGRPETLTVKPGSTEVRTVVYTPTEPGLKRGRFEIVPRTPDAFPDDDRFEFTLAALPRVKVLLVNGNASPDEFQDEAHFLKTALTSKADPDPVGPASRAGPGAGAARLAAPTLPTTREIQQALEVQTVPQAALTQALLRDASVVVLANCGALSDAQFQDLRAFVRGGGGLAIFPGDRVADVSYNTRFFPVPGPQGEKLTDARLLPATGDPENADTYSALEFDTGHPALVVFANPQARHFKTVRVYRHFGLEVPKKARNARVLAWFEGTQKPAVVESNLGEGTVLLAAFPAHPRWGNLPLKPDFVPLMLRLVSHIEHRPEAEAPAVVVADGTAEIALSSTWDPAEVTVKPPTGPAIALPLERSGARLLGAFEKTAQRGVYTVEARSTRPDLVKTAKLGFAVNLAPEESDFSLVGEADIRKLLPDGVSLTYVDASAQAQDLQGTMGQQRELWGVFIWVLFAIIGVEFLLATVSGRKREGDEGPTLTERVMDVSTGAWVGRMTGAPGKEEK